MADSEWPTELVRIGYQAQERFDSYAVALTFAVLGLSIQTARFTGDHMAGFFELVSWFFLLVSGLAGMARLAHTPKVYQFMGLHAGQENRLTQLRRDRARGLRVIHALDTGTDLEIDGVIMKDERDLAKIDNAIKAVQGKSQWGYRIRSAAFLAGMTTLAIARGIGPFVELVAAWRAAT